MSESTWERKVAVLGVAIWDEATELVSMIADDFYPSVIDTDVRHEMAARCVVAMAHDEDYRRCITAILESALDRQGSIDLERAEIDGKTTEP